MRDIGSRIKRYRLSRYAPPENRALRRLRWLWPLVALWIVWFAAISDHSLWRIWVLSQADARATRLVGEARAEIDRLEARLRDPRAAQAQAEALLRRNGMARPTEIIYRISDRDPAPMPKP